MFIENSETTQRRVRKFGMKNSSMAYMYMAYYLDLFKIKFNLFTIFLRTDCKILKPDF